MDDTHKSTVLVLHQLGAIIIMRIMQIQRQGTETGGGEEEEEQRPERQ